MFSLGSLPQEKKKERINWAFNYIASLNDANPVYYDCDTCDN
jgi:hypothetical protein